MNLYTVDTSGDNNLFFKAEEIKPFSLENNKIISKNVSLIDNEGEYEEESFGGFPPSDQDISHLITKALASVKKPKVKSSSKSSLDVFCAEMGWSKDLEPKKKQIYKFNVLPAIDKGLCRPNIEEELKNNTITGMEKLKNLPQPSDRKLKELKKIERSKTKGKEWFNMPATEITEEVGNDLKILQMRSVLNPKHFYKKNDLKVLPKYFQVGTVQPSPLDFYNEKGIRKTKKKSLVEELLADAEFQQYNKRKYKEIMEQKQKYGYHKANKKMKKLKKKKI